MLDLTDNLQQNSELVFDYLRKTRLDKTKYNCSRTTVIGDIMIEGLPKDAFQLMFFCRFAENKTYFHIESIRFTNSYGEYLKDGFQKLYSLKLISFFDQMKWRIDSQSDSSLVFVTEEIVEFHGFFVSLFSFLANQEYNVMSLHSDLFPNSPPNLDIQYFNEQIFQKIEEISVFNS
ncbi:MAG: hypothetical protein ACRCXZ_02440, partial [Patescibacteria group bacterium]